MSLFYILGTTFDEQVLSGFKICKRKDTYKN